MRYQMQKHWDIVPGAVVVLSVPSHTVGYTSITLVNRSARHKLMGRKSQAQSLITPNCQRLVPQCRHVSKCCTLHVEADLGRFQDIN
jgi:hypothetical protein